MASTTQPAAGPFLSPGDPAPWFEAATAANPRFHFATAAAGTC